MAWIVAAPFSAIGQDSPDVAFVTIGQPGNRADERAGCGAVAYPFRMGRTEVSNEAYAEFLNAVAAEGDPYGLFTPLMTTHFLGGLLRETSAAGGSIRYRYAPKPGYAAFPVTFVAWTSAIRYANWLHYDAPATGRSILGTTEGTTEFGAYDTSEWPDALPERRNPAARVFLPTCDEWVKAAFHDPVSGRYADSTTGSREPVSAPHTAGRPGSANFYAAQGWANPAPHLAPVDAYPQSASAYGTLNQGGNVLEWLEDRLGPQRAARGGSLFMGAYSLRRDYRDTELPDHRLSTLGFRVAARAEPSSVVTPPPEAVDRFAAARAARAASKAERSVPAFVRVTHAGNASDPLTGRGAVAYEFEIARLAVSNRDYAAFLEAVAAESDPAGLYHPSMTTGILGGIERTERDGRTRYAAKRGWEDRPATYLKWYDVARYCNWLHFGRPTGRQEVGLTEGSATTGAYDTSKFPFAGRIAADPSDLPVRRNPGARYFIPSDDEWYKAAYFDPTREGPRPYWLYPTRTDDPPAARPEDAAGAAANYQAGDVLALGPPAYLADVGAFESSHSHFGTVQQGGNVWEWVEDWNSRGRGSCWRCNEWTRGLRGGSFGYTYRGLSALNRDPGDPALGLYIYGARVAKAAGEAGWQPPSLFDRGMILAKSAYKAVERDPAPAFALMAGGGLIGLGAAAATIAAFAALARSARRRRSRSAVG